MMPNRQIFPDLSTTDDDFAALHQGARLLVDVAQRVAHLGHVQQTNEAARHGRSHGGGGDVFQDGHGGQTGRLGGRGRGRGREETRVGEK